MKHTKSKLALAVIAATGLAACGGSDNNNNNNTGQAPISSINGDVTNLDSRGAWGSIVLSGYGKVNAANSDDQLTSEAVPDDVTRWFGGTDNSDSSGTIKYAVVAESGEAFRNDQEVQGITIEAAGSGTTLSNIQVINSDDDAMEWFGGAADARNLVLQAATDDSLDQDLGYRGTVKKALVIQGPSSGNRGMETDNNSTLGASPKTQPVLANVTVLGHRGNTDDDTAGALHRQGFGGEVYRSVYTDNTSNVAGGGNPNVTSEFEEACLDVDNEIDGDMAYGDVVFDCAAGSFASDSEVSGNDYAQEFVNNQNPAGNVDTSTDVGVDNQTLAITSQPMTTSNGNSLPSTPAGNSVSSDGYYGAVDPGAPAADDNPSNSGPFWDGWVYRDADLSTNLPSTDGAAHHPLKADIGKSGSGKAITPASSADCGNIAGGLDQAGTADVFGVKFPVCVIEDGDLDGNYTLTSDHVYVLDGTVEVGNGDVESAKDRSTVKNRTLTIKPGTQIMGATGTQPSLVITRGSTIDATGTAKLPIIFGAVNVKR